MESAKISSSSLDYKRCQKASFQAIKRKTIYSDGQRKSPLIFIYRILSFARGLIRSIGQSRSLPGQPTSPSRTLDEHFSSSSRALLTQHGNKVVNKNVQKRPFYYDGVNLLYINFQNIEIYNCQEFEIIVQLMMYANIIFKACFKKHKLYTYKISYRIIGVTREKKNVLRTFDVALFLWSRILAVTNVKRYIVNNTIDFIFFLSRLMLPLQNEISCFQASKTFEQTSQITIQL